MSSFQSLNGLISNTIPINALYFDPTDESHAETINKFCSEDSAASVELFQKYCRQTNGEAITDNTFSASILVSAIENQNVALVSYIAQHTNKVALNFRDLNGLTPLHHVMKADGPASKSIAIAKILIDAGADVNGLATAPGKNFINRNDENRSKALKSANNTQLSNRRYLGSQPKGTTPLGQVVKELAKDGDLDKMPKHINKRNVRLARFLIKQGASCRIASLGEIRPSKKALEDDSEIDEGTYFDKLRNRSVVVLTALSSKT